MTTYELYMAEDGYTWITGEVYRTPSTLRDGQIKWDVNWEGGSFTYYGGKQQLKAKLRKMAERGYFGEGCKLIIGKEVSDG